MEWKRLILRTHQKLLEVFVPRGNSHKDKENHPKHIQFPNVLVPSQESHCLEKERKETAALSQLL